MFILEISIYIFWKHLDLTDFLLHLSYHDFIYLLVTIHFKLLQEMARK